METLGVNDWEQRTSEFPALVAWIITPATQKADEGGTKFKTSMGIVKGTLSQIKQY